MNDGISYDSSKVVEGVKVINDDLENLEKAKNLITKGFETIKKAKGYAEVESKLMIKDGTIIKMLDDCSKEFITLSTDVSSLVNSLEKFDEVDNKSTNNLNMPDNNKSITQDQVKEAIKENFTHNEDLTNMFNQSLYTKLNEELNNMVIAEEGLNNGSK